MPYNLHLDKWLERSQEDFYTLFVKSWIPFNAWYKREIAPQANSDSDRDCINFICRNSNAYKDKLLSCLKGNNREDLYFQQEMVDLHHALVHNQIPDAENPITFKTTTIYDISHPLEENDFYSIHYKIERVTRMSGNGFDYDVKVVDRSTGALKFNARFNRWKMEDLESHNDFAQFSNTIKKRLKESFYAVYIGAPTDLIMEPIMKCGTCSKPPHSIPYGKENTVYFIEDKDKIAQVLIQLIYKLRNQIFHGAIEPTIRKMEVYEHAYKIQRILIKDLN